MKKQLRAPIFGILLLIGPVMALALESAVLNQHPLESQMPWSYVLDDAGKGWFAYYGSEDNTLYVRAPQGSETGLGVTDRQRAQSGLAIAPAGQNLAVLWRDKLPNKTLYLLPALRSGEESAKPLEVSGEESEALTRLRLAHRDGITYLLWLGEKGDKEKGERYHLYFRSVESDGKTLSPVERVLPGAYPAWIVDKDLLPVFAHTLFESKLSVVMRIFDRAKKTFGTPIKIADAPPISPFFQTFEAGGRWFVLWVGHYGDTQEQLLEGVYSEDKGRNWKRFSFEKLRGLDVSHLETTADAQGHIVIAVSGAWHTRDPKAKDDVYLIRSTDNGATWSEPLQPRPAELQTFEARDPSVAFGAKPGAAMLIWEDWRNIRPNIHIQFSTDYGATWGKALSLDPSPATRLGLDFTNRTAWAVGDRYQVIAKRYKNDTFQQIDMVRYEFTPDELQQQAADAAKQRDTERFGEARLRERVQTFWQAMEAQDLSASYAFQDPFYRARAGYDVYKAARGTIKYEGHEILGITRQGALAKVQVKFDASVPEVMFKGKPYSQPRKSFEHSETWLFVDGDWFREYYDQANDVRFTKY
ncbi:MAG: exo-alpha-sialidase [Candidatus Competibacter sp.]|nr:exo-alpha-sialidase [Candidatus Competibacter sp.]MDG4604553.1 sialidase family protein [Candidatus Contendobacter sp.]HRD48217.1 sialidase family protein [Candidatus Contendobacter sp.]